MLSTIDNPYDPFTQYEEWEAYDARAGYYTPQFLARIAYTSHELSEEQQNEAIESAIDEIVEQNVIGVYKKVEAPEGFVA
jgi:hypothetical protein